MDEEKLTQEEQTDIPSVPADWAYPKIFENTVVLNGGIMLKGMIQKLSFSNRIWIILNELGLNYSKIVELFSDPAKTEIIKYNVNANEYIMYTGYVNLASINIDSDGKFTVSLSN